jgi:hypothetical protein
MCNTCSAPKKTSSETHECHDINDKAYYLNYFNIYCYRTFLYCSKTLNKIVVPVPTFKCSECSVHFVTIDEALGHEHKILLLTTKENYVDASSTSDNSLMHNRACTPGNKLPLPNFLFLSTISWKNNTGTLRCKLRQFTKPINQERYFSDYEDF